MASETNPRGAAHDAPSQPRVQGEATAEADLTWSAEVDQDVQPEIQKPRMKWVYNSDYTDPVNFGFMFLVPDDGFHDVLDHPVLLPSADSAPSTTFTAPTTFPGTSQAIVTPPANAASNPVPEFISEGSYLSEVYRKSSSSSPDAFQQINPHATFFTSPGHQPANDYNTYQNVSHTPVSYPPSSSSYSVSSPHNLVYRPSPHFASSSISPQQLSPLDHPTWQTQNQNQSQYSGYFPPQWNMLNTSSSPEQSYTPATSGLTPELINAPTLNQKRKYARSPSLSVEVISGGVSSRIISKRRRGPQADLMPIQDFDRIPEICSRCHIYQVANFTPEQTRDLLNRQHQSKDPGVCNLCLQEFNLYQWPSAGQSRLENLESLVLFLLPAHMEDSILSGPAYVERTRSWRGFFVERPHAQYDFDALTMHQDQWAQTIKQARSTLLWGDDASHLTDIIRNYQNSLSKPNVSLQASSTCFNAVCDLYNCFVSSPTRPPTCSAQEMITHVRTVRITLRNAFQHLQHLALSPTPTRDRKDWFPTFLSAVIITMAAITFMDILGSCPSPYKERIWGLDWGQRIKEMRHGGYGMLIGVLRANTNGVNPLKLTCWTEDAAADRFIIETPTTYEKGKRVPRFPATEAERERDVLLGRQSPAALRGMLELKRWQARYRNDLVIGEDMFQKEMYAQAMMRPVASLWKIFEMKDTSGL